MTGGEGVHKNDNQPTKVTREDAMGNGGASEGGVCVCVCVCGLRLKGEEL